MILTFNEEPNIARTLGAVKWANRILVVDSGSTDQTVRLVEEYPQASVVTRAFDSFAQQCNFGLSLITSNWVLSLDADYELSDSLIGELHQLNPNEDVAGFRCSFIYRIHGRPLRSNLYPARTVLYRRSQAIYLNEGHGHRVKIDGSVRDLTGPIFHDDRKPLVGWLASQQKYAKVEVDYLLTESPELLGRIDRIRLLGWPSPLLVFFYTLLLKRSLLDGWAGWFYVLQRTLAEIMIALEIIDRRLQRK